MAGTDSMFEQLWLRLTQAVALCRAEADKEAVHAVRTGSRRMEALLRKAMEDHRGAEQLHRAIEKTLRRLKRIRKLAGPVRDFDVQRKLVDELREEMLAAASAEERPAIEHEAECLDSRMRRERKRAVADLRKGLTKLELPLERALRRTSAVMEGLGSGSPLPLSTAKGWTKSSAVETGRLNEENLHDFRKRTKAARYVAELQEGSKAARAFARELHGVQNAIGLWHDWDLLREQAKKFAGNHTALVDAMQTKRDEALAKALRRAAKIEQR